MSENSIKLISFVIPCYYSEHTLASVVQEIDDIMRTLPQYTHEVILVNDGSKDGTWNVIKTLAKEKTNIVGVNFAKNFGQQAATIAGFRHAKGDAVIAVDDDGQIPVNETNKLLQKLEEGSDVVIARYEHKKHSLFRNLGSKVNSYMTCKLLKKPKDLFLSSFFACRRFVIDEVCRYTNPYPYTGGLILQATSNIVNVDVTHRKRNEGKSGYTLRKLISLWLNGFTNFSVEPLRIATKTGTVIASLGFLYAVYLVIKKLVNPAVPQGYASIMAAILVIGGIQMIMLGLIGEYLGRAFISINKAPQYVEKEVVEKRL